MTVGIGLDSNEYNRPLSPFDEVFSLARRDGFRVTAHCDVGQKDTHEHIRQVVSTIGGGGADRVDHRLNAADRQPNHAEGRRHDGVSVCLLVPTGTCRHLLTYS
jgi:adenosine deaminase